MSSTALRLFALAFSKKLLVTMTIVLLYSNAYSQKKNFSLDQSLPSWIVKINCKGIRPNEKDITNGYFLSVYENQNHAELQEEYTHVIREIVSDAGVQNGSQISVTYDPEFQKLVFHKIILWRGNIASDQLSANKFKIIQTEKDLSKFIYSGSYDALLLLDDVRKGDRIEYAFTLKGTNPIFGRKYASQFYFEGSSSIGELYMNLIADKKRSLSIKNFNGAKVPVIVEKGKNKLYEWRENRTKTYRTADYEPSWYNPFKRVQLTEYKNWNEVVNWGLSVNDYPGLKSKALDKKVQEFGTLTGSNKKKYIELAVRFVQDEIRYMGIEMGIYSHRPNSPDKVLKQRYGDCKDKSLLLVHLLKAAGIPAYMVYADTYSTIKTNDYLPSPFIFNHVIVAIEYGKQKIWIDPTISYQRSAFSDFYVPDYGYVLQIKPGVNALEKINSKPKGKLVAKLSFKIADTLSEEKSTLVIKSKYIGNYANNIRSTIAESGIDALQKDYLEYYGKYYTDIESLDSIDVKDDEIQNIVELTERYMIDNIWTQAEDSERKYIYVYGDLISNELNKITAAKRLQPLSLKYPVNIEQNISLEMPYNAEYSTEEVEINNENYVFKLENSQDSNTVHFNYSFKSLRPFIAGSEIKKYVKDYKKISENLSYTLHSGRGIYEPEQDQNPYIILVVFLTAVSSIILAVRFYQKPIAYDLDKLTQAKPIGGWLILLAIQLIIQPISIASTFFAFDFFAQKTWTEIDNQEGIRPLAFQFLLTADLIAITLLLVSSIAVLVLFFNRRENFAKVYIAFAKADIILSILTFLLLKLMDLKSLPVESFSSLWSLGISIVVCLLWIWYIKKSERVRQTFVFTYPELECTKALIRYYNKKLTAKNDNHEDI